MCIHTINIILVVACYASLRDEGHRTGDIGKSKGTGVLAEGEDPGPQETKAR